MHAPAGAVRRKKGLFHALRTLKSLFLLYRCLHARHMSVHANKICTFFDSLSPAGPNGQAGLFLRGYALSSGEIKPARYSEGLWPETFLNVRLKWNGSV